MRRYTRRELLELAARFAPALPLATGGLGLLLEGCGPSTTGTTTGEPGTGTGTGAATGATGAPPATAAAEPNEPLPMNVKEALRAAMARIFPADEEPGAIELGAFEYLESQLALPTFKTVNTQLIYGGVVLDRLAVMRAEKRFHLLEPALQDDVLAEFAAGVDMKRGLDTRDVFTKLLYFTMEGTLGPPSYGANKDGAGWKIVGFALHRG